MAGIKLKRNLSEPEKQFAVSVFGRTLPLDRIFVSNTQGLGQRPYTTPELKYQGGWILHLGSSMYANAIHKDWQHVFVHELVHVWQSYHSPIRWGYVANSVCHQVFLLKGSRAYDYTPGKAWGEYQIEQQAQIVEDWFDKGKASVTDPLYPYVRDHIRRGIN